ncbi:MAG: cell division protein ZipA C-terminal FtsZ-binding domain-containing protein, partial [Cocleimonas sp.]
TSTNEARTSASDETAKKERQAKQLILFISANDETGLDGNLVAKALTANNLKLGDKDIYHYYTENKLSKSSLFRVANGTEPWTLTTKDLQDKKLAGLSIVMSLPSPIEDKKAVKLLISVSKDLCKKINGSLKNHKQQAFTRNDEKEIMKL